MRASSPPSTPRDHLHPHATASINPVARSWGDANIERGDEILLTAMEHHSNLVPWQQLAERTGAVCSHIPITDDGLLVLDVLDALLTERTKIVAVASVSNVLGTINPVAEIAAAAHAAGALVLVDAAQSVPHLPTDVQALGADFLAFSGHKMLGPDRHRRALGRDGAARRDAAVPGRRQHDHRGSICARPTSRRRAAREVRSRHAADRPAIGLGAAIDYLNAIGIDAVREHEHELVRYAYERCAEIDGLEILGPAPGPRAGLVSFTLPRATRTTSPSSSTSRASPSAPATTARSRCTTGWISPPARAPASISTRRARTSTRSWPACSRSSASSTADAVRAPGQPGASDRQVSMAHCQSAGSSNSIRIAAPDPTTAE